MSKKKREKRKDNKEVIVRQSPEIVEVPSKPAASKPAASNQTVSVTPLKWFVAIVPFFAGLYYEWAAWLAGLFLVGYIFFCYKKTGYIKIKKNAVLYFSVVLVIMYGLSALWAVDHGMALFGFVKFMPVLIFVIAFNQVEKEVKAEIMDYIPISGCIMTVASVVFGKIPGFSDYVMVYSRLAGFFQYPNTFALYLVVGLAILLSVERWNVKKIILSGILLAGIGLTGSRTGFIILALLIFIYFFTIKDKRIKRGLLIGLGLLIAVAGIYVVVTGNTWTIGRIFTLSLSSSTFIGRILYCKDALPIILKHPFGLGYLGYYFTQGSFQTGVYTVMNIHNELFQILLDIGWISAVLFLYVIVQGLRKGSFRNKLILFLIVLHSMLDYNLQFIAMFFVFIIVAFIDEGKEVKIKPQSPAFIMSLAIGCLGLYLGIASLIYSVKIYDVAARIYPGNTLALMELMKQTEDVEALDELADKVIKLNDSVALAYSAKAKAAYAEGDFSSVILYKRKVLELSKYQIREYKDYFEMLYVGMQLYSQQGDEESAQICKDELLSIKTRIDRVLADTDELGYKFDTKPRLNLPEEYLEILEQIKEEERR